MATKTNNRLCGLAGTACAAYNLLGAAANAACNNKTPCPPCAAAALPPSNPPSAGSAPTAAAVHPIAGTALAQQLSTNGANALAALYPPMPPMPPNPAAQASSVPPSAVTVQPATQAAVVQAVGAWATLGSAPVPNPAQHAAIAAAPTAQGGKWVGRLLAYLQQCCPNAWCPGSGIYNACGGASTGNVLAYPATLASAVPNSTVKRLANGNSLPTMLHVQYIGNAPYYAYGANPPNGPSNNPITAVPLYNVGSRPRGGNVATATQPAIVLPQAAPVVVQPTAPTLAQLQQLATNYPAQAQQLLAACPLLLVAMATANSNTTALLQANGGQAFAQLLAMPHGKGSNVLAVFASIAPAVLQNASNLQQLLSNNTPA